MKSYEKEIIQSGLDNEKFTLARLKAAYRDALEEVKDRVAILQSREQTQSVIYQLKYQQELEKQLKTIYDKMYNNMYDDVHSYLQDCYTDGFTGALYSLQQQGIPLVFPINQEEAAQMAGQTTGNIKLSKRLYQNQPKTVRDVRDVITRGLATNSSYTDIARNIAKVSAPTVSQAYRIARTEGHRIQNEVNYKTLQTAKDSGADVVKQWDATIDKRTRPHHAELDGQIRELNESFEVAGRTALYAGGFGVASEDINCRCTVLQRARWALDEDELATLKDRAAYFGLDKNKDFDDFKKKFLKVDEEKLKKQLQDEYDNAVSKYQKILDKYQDKKDLYANGSSDDITEATKLDAQFKGLEAQGVKKKTIKSKFEKLTSNLHTQEKNLAKIDDKTYSGIWKDDVKVSDYKLKKGSVKAKKDYYKDQIKKLQGLDDPVSKAKVAQFQKYLDDLDEFETLGKKYEKIQNKIDKINIERKPFIPKPKEAELFTQTYKDNAYWFTDAKGGTAAADKVLRSKSGEVWKNADMIKRSAAYSYTSGSGSFNRPLSGFQKPYYEGGSGWESKYYKGKKNVWIDFEGAGDEIRNFTDLIDKSEYDFDIWVQRGGKNQEIEEFLGIPFNSLHNMTDSELQNFVGKEGRRNSFVSTGVAKGKGFSGEVITNIYAPRGSKMIYAEPFSAFGCGKGLNWDGASQQDYFGIESEMIIQRGGYYKITKIERKNGTLYIDMEHHPEKGYDLFQQDPKEWKGSNKSYKD